MKWILRVVLADQTLLLSGWSNSPGYTQGQEDFLAIKVSGGIASDKFCPHQMVTGRIQDSVITSQIQVDSAGRSVSSYLEHPIALDHVSVNLAGESICLCIASINDEKISSFNISPNPAQQLLAVSSEEIQFKKLAYSIIDITGKSIMEGSMRLTTTSFQLDVNHLPQGIYILLVKKEGDILCYDKWIKD